MRKLTADQVDHLVATVAANPTLDGAAKESVTQSIRLGSDLYPRDDGKRTAILLVVLGGLVAMGLLLTYFTFSLLNDAKDTTLLVPVLTAIIAGLVGLFVPSPAGNGQ